MQQFHWPKVSESSSVCSILREVYILTAGTDGWRIHTLTPLLTFCYLRGQFYEMKKKAMVASGKAAELILIEILELLRWMCFHRWEPTPTEMLGHTHTHTQPHMYLFLVPNGVFCPVRA